MTGNAIPSLQTITSSWRPWSVSRLHNHMYFLKDVFFDPKLRFICELLMIHVYCRPPRCLALTIILTFSKLSLNNEARTSCCVHAVQWQVKVSVHSIWLMLQIISKRSGMIHSQGGRCLASQGCHIVILCQKIVCPFVQTLCEFKIWSLFFFLACRRCLPLPGPAVGPGLPGIAHHAAVNLDPVFWMKGYVIVCSAFIRCIGVQSS